jgi:hypothetical protein
MARTNLAQPIDGALSTRGRGEFGSAGIARSGNRGPVVVTDKNGGTGVSQPFNDGSWTPTSKHNGNGTAAMVSAGNVLPGLGLDLSSITSLFTTKNMMIAAALGVGLFLMKRK